MEGNKEYNVPNKVKKLVYINKRKASRDLGRRMNINLWENNKLFLKELNMCREGVYVKSKDVLYKLRSLLVAKDEIRKKKRK